MSRSNRRGRELERLGVVPDPSPVLEIALTHRSYAFEQPVPPSHNERLEFLGDAVLGIVVADLLYRRYPDMPEGDMAKLRSSVVNEVALAEIARELDLGDHVKLGRGEEASGGRDKASVLADTFEAVIAGAYLEKGLAAVSDVLEPILSPRLEHAARTGDMHDPKTLLQEVAVKETGARPEYRVAGSGPDHDRRFVASVYIDGSLCGTGMGHSKKEAEQRAAKQALEKVTEDRATLRSALPVDDGTSDARAS